MLNYLPKIYPDELWGSVIARTFFSSGYVICKYFAQNIFKGKQECLNNVFINSYKKDFARLINKVYGCETVINHTLIPFYLLTSGANKKHLYRRAIKYDRTVNKSLAIPKDIDCHLKYCELCRRDDIEQYGEPYWHISHQVINYCPKHCCKLVTSSVPYTRYKSYSFEPLINYDSLLSTISFKEKSDINILFDAYVTDVLKEAIFLNADSINNYLRSFIPDYYFKDVLRERIDSKKLYSDITNFFKGLDGIEKLTAYRIRSILNSTQINVRDYLLITYFFGLSPKDAIKVRVAKTDNKIVNKLIALYKKKRNIHYVSKIMHLDRRVVRRVIKHNTKVLQLIN